MVCCLLFLSACGPVWYGSLTGRIYFFCTVWAVKRRCGTTAPRPQPLSATATATPGDGHAARPRCGRRLPLCPPPTCFPLSCPSRDHGEPGGRAPAQPPCPSHRLPPSAPPTPPSATESPPPRRRHPATPPPSPLGWPAGRLAGHTVAPQGAHDGRAASARGGARRPRTTPPTAYPPQRARDWRHGDVADPATGRV